jgi:hypothetical protein
MLMVGKGGVEGKLERDMRVDKNKSDPINL